MIRSKLTVKNIIESVLADVGCPLHTNRNFKYFEHKGIKHAGIKIRKNPTIIPSINDNSLKNREVYSQIKDLFKWKKIIRYGQR